MAELVLALDLPDRDTALRLLDRLDGLRWVKVGPMLLTGEGTGMVHELAGRGLKVFLDLKWHDIPNTVQGAVAAARDAGVAMATVHTLGGQAMMRAAAAAAGGEVRLVGVTVLTSHDAADYGEAVGRPGVDLGLEVERQAANAMRGGLAGVVCSSREVERVRAVLPAAASIVVPGIRRPGEESGDQHRVADPVSAARAGATHLVVGRPIVAAADPGRALAEYLEVLR